jgi:two-component system phosphate regulon response regulator OmpR
MRMAAATLLIVDDEPELLKLLAEYFGGQGFRVLTAADAVAARAILADTQPEVAVLDVHLPGEDGLALARWLRVQRPCTGILMLSTAAETVDRIVGLEIGADDYVGKPFELRELHARIKGLLRRAATPAAAASAAAPQAPSAAPTRRVPFGTCTLDLDQRRLVDAEGRDVEISAAEFDLMHLFVRNPGRALNRDQIMEGAHNRSWDVFDRSIDLRVMRLRRKVERNPEKPEFIKTVRGIGYVYVPGGRDA